MGNFSLHWHRKERDTPLLRAFNEAALLVNYSDHPKEFVSLWADMAHVLKKENPAGFEQAIRMMQQGAIGERA